MKTRTTIAPLKTSHFINSKDTLVALGSCFATEIGDLLVSHHYDCLINPYGVVYNPAALDFQLQQLLLERPLIEEHFVERDGFQAHLDYHSKVRGQDEDDFKKNLENINHRFHEALLKASTVLLTFGTAFVFEYISTGRTVTNCHKVPGQLFNRKLLSITACREHISQLIESITSYNSDCHLICTVSPVRHIRDGLVSNARSKAHLLSALHQAIEAYPRCTYFPSYEIMIDELRDYKYYKEDLIHPSEAAVRYVWERFESTFINRN